MDDAIADTVVTALQIADQRAVSDLGAMLAAVATSTRETVAMQLRINAARARTYRTAQLIAVIVAFFVGLLVLTNRDYMEPFGTVVGQLVLAAVVAPRRRVDLGDGRAVPPASRSPPAPSRCDAVIWAAILAAMLGAGVWLIARALVPPPRPLQTLSAELVAATRGRRTSSGGGRAPLVAPPGGAASAPARRRGWPPTSPCSVGRRRATRSTSSATPSALRRSRPRAGGRCSRCSTPACPPLPMVRGRAAVRRRRLVLPGPRGPLTRAAATRRAWAQALTVYVDIVGISLAGGAGVEEALMVAARAGSGPQFEELDATLRAAQTRRRKLWHALDDLGARADIVPLRELAAAVDLAAESGSRIRETLLAKANALRVRQLTEAEADAQRASETMGIAPALMAVAAVVLIGYPAVARFFEQ